VTVDCKFFQDSDEVNKIVWYPAAAGAEVLPFPSRFRPRSQAYFGWVDSDIGEVSQAPAKLNHKKTPPFLLGPHVCGSVEDFRRGCVRDETPPLVAYDHNQIPVCCEPLIVADGGIACSGTADISVTVPTTYAATYYIANAILGAAGVAVTTIPQQEWQSPGSTYPAPPFILLRSPSYPGNTKWTLEVFDSFRHCTWDYPATYNGHGVQFFFAQTGPCSAWFVSDTPFP